MTSATMTADPAAALLRNPDGTNATVYPASDEALHPPGAEPNWQESVAMCWYDLAADVGGFLRIGHEPVLDGGNMTLWGFVHSPHHAYCRSEQFTKRPDDVDVTGMGAGGVARYDVVGTATRWQLNDGGTSCDLTVEPLHDPVGLWPMAPEDQTRHIAAHHFEVANRITGTVAIEGREYRIDGKAHRDHSWGPRDWGLARVHRWMNGVFDDGLSFCLLTVNMGTAATGHFGYVIRDGVLHHSTDVDIVVHMEPDGATHRGGWGRIVLANDEEMTFVAEPLCKGFYGYKRGAAMFESPCRIRYGDRIGVGDLEISENSRLGTSDLVTLINAHPSDGVHVVEDWPYRPRRPFPGGSANR